MRTLLAPLAAALFGLAPLAGAGATAAADAVTLIPAPEVVGRAVTAGDLFAGPAVAEVADRFLFRAPAPGQHYEVTRSQLQRIARIAGLQYDARLAPDSYIVRRASTLIDKAFIASELAFALEDAGAIGPLTLAVRGGLKDIHVALDQPADILIQDVAYDRRTKHFSATVIAALDSPTPLRLPLVGTAHTGIEVPVLINQLIPGDIIDHEDLEYVMVRADRLPRNTVTDGRDLVGMTPNRLLKIGEPVHKRLVSAPTVFAKGARVTMIVHAGPMTLTALGRAEEAGAQGKIVRVTNVDSGRSVEARVLGPDRVEVLATGGAIVATN